MCHFLASCCDGNGHSLQKFVLTLSREIELVARLTPELRVALATLLLSAGDTDGAEAMIAPIVHILRASPAVARIAAEIGRARRATLPSIYDQDDHDEITLPSATMDLALSR
jgi:hypothetical protein